MNGQDVKTKVIFEFGFIVDEAGRITVSGSKIPTDPLVALDLTGACCRALANFISGQKEKSNIIVPKMAGPLNLN